jgi:hypothetical protein
MVLHRPPDEEPAKRYPNVVRSCALWVLGLWALVLGVAYLVWRWWW